MIHDDGGEPWVAEVNARTARATARISAGAGPEGLAELAVLSEQCRRRLGADHRQTFRVEANEASWIGQSGDPLTAATALSSLYDRARSVLGEQDPDTLLLGNNAAAFTGLAGDPRRAVTALTALLPVVESVYGTGSDAATDVRTNLAAWRRHSAAAPSDGR